MDKKHFCVLHYIYKHPYISFVRLQSRFKAYLDLEKIVEDLVKDKMLSCRIAESQNFDQGYEHMYVEASSHLVCLSAGNEFIELKFQNNTRWNITTGIAFFAAIGAFREELAFLLQSIAKLLK